MDILFGMAKTYTVLDEMIIAGEFSEPSLKNVSMALQDVDVFNQIKQILNEEKLMDNLGVDPSKF